MRLFIALPFSEDALDALCATQDLLRKAGVSGNFAPRKNLHMTLAFLGEVPSAKPVLSVLRQVPPPETVITFSGFGRIRDILTAELSVDPALSVYVRDLRNAMDDARIDYDRKPFRPHVTLVRRAELPHGKIADSWNAPLSGVESPLERVCLMRTDFIDRRAVYTVLEECRPVL